MKTLYASLLLLYRKTAVILKIDFFFLDKGRFAYRPKNGSFSHGFYSCSTPFYHSPHRTAFEFFDNVLFSALWYTLFIGGSIITNVQAYNYAIEMIKIYGL